MRELSATARLSSSSNSHENLHFFANRCGNALDDDVAAGGGMAVVAKIPALKFKFDPHSFPPIRPDSSFRFAIGKTVLDRFDKVT